MEIWKDISGFEGFYQVSNLGRVKSVARKVFRKGSARNPKGNWLTIGERILKPLQFKTPRGGLYHKVFLWREHEYRQEAVHILVCETFHGPRPAGHLCCHEDGNGLNNKSANLYWGTPFENAADTKRHGRQVMGEAVPWSVLTQDNVREIRRLAGSMSQCEIGEKFGVEQGHISRIVTNKVWRHVV